MYFPPEFHSPIWSQHLTYMFSFTAQHEPGDDPEVTRAKYFIRDEFGRRRTQFGRQARAIVSEGVQQGLGRRQISEDLERRLGHSTGRTRAYWEVVASSFANRARSWAQLSSFEEGGIDRYVFEAVLDRATTDTCRFLHGKKFQTSAGLEKFREVEKSGTRKLSRRSRLGFGPFGTQTENRCWLFTQLIMNYRPVLR